MFLFSLAQESETDPYKAGLLTDCAEYVPQTGLLKRLVQWHKSLLNTKHSNSCCAGFRPASLFTCTSAGTLKAYSIFCSIIAYHRNLVNSSIKCKHRFHIYGYISLTKADNVMYNAFNTLKRESIRRSFLYDSK